MKKLFCLLIAALLMAGLQTMNARQITAQGEKLLAAAHHKATVDGDLKGAIEGYKKIVAGAGADRALAAQALVQMAECYQKLGDLESSKIYERVLREYADQTDAVSVARARLGRIRSAAGETGIVTRQVWTGPKVGALGTVSADGRFVSFVDWSTGDLAVHDLTTGTDRRLTNKGTWLESPLEWAEESAISPDGRQVAYIWSNKLQWELRVVGVEGTAPGTPRQLHTDESVVEITPSTWSPDGRWVAVQTRRKDGTAHIGLVNPGDGSVRTLKSTDGRLSTRLFFSTDGKYLAFDLPSSDKSGDRDVFVLAVDESREIPAVVYPGNDVAVGWTPDGRHLLFASNRGGSKGLWALPWADGKPQGEPELIKTDINLEAPLGVTRAGALYYGVTLSQHDVYVAELDANSGNILSPPTRPIEQFVGTNHSPDWSPDGKSLAYVSRKAILAIRAMDSGQTRELRPALSAVYLPRWAPDGRSLAVLGLDEKGRQGVYRVDAQTGATSLIVQVPAADFLWGLEWLPDGRRIVYRHTAPGAAIVFEHDIDSGARREIVRRAASLTLSPDGRYLAYVAGPPPRQLMIVPLAGGPPREVPLQNVQGPIMVIAWTPDGRSILFQSSTPTGKLGTFWLISADGGQPRKVGLNLRPTVAPLRFNPKTNQVAVTANMPRQEVWVMEHFLPGTKISRRP
jgi:Tol biopolymer transport system component